MKNIILSVLIISLFSCANNNKKEKTIFANKESTPVKKDSSNEISKIQFNGKCDIENEVSSLGIGVVIAPVKLAIYDDSLLSGIPVMIDMYAQSETLTGHCTLTFYPEYGLMHFACIGKTAEAYQVLINYSQVKYLPKEKGYIFQTWEQYIKSSFGVRRKTTRTGEQEKPIGTLQKEPNDKADTIAIPDGLEMFCAMQLQGDWIKVQYNCFYNMEHDPYEGQPCHNFIQKCKDPLTGWLRWRQGNKLLIDIFLMP